MDPVDSATGIQASPAEPAAVANTTHAAPTTKVRLSTARREPWRTEEYRHDRTAVAWVVRHSVRHEDSTIPTVNARAPCLPNPHRALAVGSGRGTMASVPMSLDNACPPAGPSKKLSKGRS